jgi:hypothetical protein
MQDAKVECASTLKWLLDRICEEAGYRVELSPVKCVLGNRYISEILLTKEPVHGEHGRHVRIIGESCLSNAESQGSALYQSVSAFSRSNGLKIIDPGFLDFRDMKRDYSGLTRVIPVLCDVVGKSNLLCSVHSDALTSLAGSATES